MQYFRSTNGLNTMNKLIKLRDYQFRFFQRRIVPWCHGGFPTSLICFCLQKYENKIKTRGGTFSFLGVKCPTHKKIDQNYGRTRRVEPIHYWGGILIYRPLPYPLRSLHTHTYIQLLGFNLPVNCCKHMRLITISIGFHTSGRFNFAKKSMVSLKMSEAKI